VNVNYTIAIMAKMIHTFQDISYSEESKPLKLMR